MNIKEKRAISAICEDFCDTFFLEDDALTTTDAVRYKITVKTDMALVNVRLYPKNISKK